MTEEEKLAAKNKKAIEKTANSPDAHREVKQCQPGSD